MKIKIKVTKEILMRSSTCTGSRLGKHCAIALAVRDVFPNAFVGKSDCSPNENAIHHDDPDQSMGLGLRGFIKLPCVAHEFIGEFDSNTPEERVQMQPISFEIEVPDSVIEKIGISQVYKILSESKTLEYIPC